MRSTDSYVVRNKNGDNIAFAGVNTHFGRPANYRKITRLVVKPAYQGIGVAQSLIEFVAEEELKNGKRIGMTTSHMGAINMLINNDDWTLFNYGKPPKDKKNPRRDMIMASFEYKRDVNMSKCSDKIIEKAKNNIK